MKKINIKKLVFSLLLAITITVNCLPLALAEDPPAAPPASSSGGSSGGQDVSNPSSSQLLPQFKYTTTSGVAATNGTKIGAVNALPNDTWQNALSSIVKTLLNISGSLTLIAMTVGGVFMVTANGNAEAIGKGKKILTYSIAGLIIISVSYAVVIGVAQLQFFTPGTADTSQGSTSGATGTSSAPAPGGITNPGNGDNGVGNPTG